jgi:hypothetical protein
MPNYENTVIYKIVSNDANINDIYIGSTTDFNIRKRQHKTDCNNIKSKSYNLKIYETIRLNGGWDNWKMIEIEKYPCNTSIESHAKERYYYDLLGGTMNTRTPNRSQKEYYETNKEHLCIKQKQYDDLNKEKKKLYARQRYIAKKERDNYIRFYNK